LSLKGDLRLWEFEIKCLCISLKIKMWKIKGGKQRKVDKNQMKRIKGNQCSMI
jgi:hypothetical protein